MDINVNANVALATQLNELLNGAEVANKVGVTNLSFVGNDKGLSISITDPQGEVQEIPFGGVRLDLPKEGAVGENAGKVLEALDKIELKTTDAGELAEAKTHIRNMLTAPNGGTPGKTGTVDTTPVDIYQIMALLVKVLQAQRDAAGISRQAQSAQAIAALERQVSEIKDAAYWGMVGGIVSCSFQLGTSAVTIGGMIAAAVKSSNCNTVHGVKFNQTNMQTAKLATDLGAAEKNVKSLSTGVFNARVQSWAKPLLEDFKSKDYNIAAAEVKLNELQGKIDGLTNLCKADPSKANVAKLETAQKEYNLVYAKKIELTAKENEPTVTQLKADLKANKITQEEFDTQMSALKGESAKDYENWGAKFVESKDALAIDPAYIGANKAFARWQVAGEVCKALGELLKTNFDYVGKNAEAAGKEAEIEEKKANAMADQMTDLYKAAKELMDGVRALLSAVTESELEVSRKIMA